MLIIYAKKAKRLEAGMGLAAHVVDELDTWKEKKIRTKIVP